MVYSIQVYSTLYSLQQIVVTYKVQAYIMVYSKLLLQVTDQSVSYYTIVVFVLFVEPEAFL